MKARRFISTLLIFPGVLALVYSLLSFATPKPESPQPEVLAKTSQTQNLYEVKHRFFDSLRVNKTADLSAATRVFIEPVEVSFSTYWEREHRMDVSSSYKRDTLERYGRILQEELARSFGKSTRFVLVDNKNEADWLLLPRLENLNIFAPDDSLGKSLVFTAGTARFNMQVIDASNSEVLVQMIDARETRDKGFNRPVQATRASNTHDFKMLMRRWSERSLEYLEEGSTTK